MLDHINSTRHAAPDREKTHYIPVFYLKQWVGPDNKMCEFSRPYKEVKALRKHPKGTGYEPDLYAIDELPLDRRHMLERDFMKQVDQYASNVLKVLLADGQLTFGLKEKVAWSRFILSLIQRSPDRVAWLCKNFDHMRDNELARLRNFRSSIGNVADLAAFDNFQKSIRPSAQAVEKALVIQAMINLPNVVERITKMRWHVVHLKNSAYRLLTSDQPVVTSDGLQYANSYILFPVSPTAIFVATNSSNTELEIDRLIRSDRFVSTINGQICIQAEKYVYDCDDTQLTFVENRLGKSKKRGTRAHQGSFPL
jgi:hypothetical protein